MTKSEPLAIYTYSLTHLSHCDKIKFHYSLKGRDGNAGVLHKTKSEQLGKAVLLVPQAGWQAVTNLLKQYQCTFKRRVVVEVPA